MDETTNDQRDEGPPPADNVSRRDFLRGLGGGIAATAVVATGVAVAEPTGAAPPPAQDGVPAARGRRLKGRVRVTLNVNGEERTADVEPRTTLLNTLRDHLDLTGAKKICDRGSCGGCTVMADGRPVYSCMMLAVDAQDRKITTVEGLGTPEKMHPVQAAFVEHDGLMCGFCTPGFVVSCVALIQHNPNPTLEDVKRACSGNVCRCGTYPRVFEAALAAAKTMRGA
jgi:aerobic-type carbon monoxide dehydrogenase small subunit (CoxS/CutS family)